ncbi:MAG: hypothetical protein ABI743_03185 [bacterium]
MHPLLPTALLILQIGSPTASGDHPYRSESLPDEGEIIQMVQVSDGAGDGALSVRDAMALAEFNVWCINRLIEGTEVEQDLGTDGEDRALIFWDYVWNSLDPETLAFVSDMDQTWPAIRARWDNGDEADHAQIMEAIKELINAAYGDQIVESVSYVAGEITMEEYEPYLETILQRFQAGPVESTETEGTSDDGASDLIHDTVSTYLGNFIEY